jgi:tetratricopeptide (TPR) repeat protein
MLFLRDHPLMPVSKMLDMGSSINKDEDQTRLFYAEAWGMVHYILFGSGKLDESKLRVYLHGLEVGTLQEKLFQQVFGDPKAFDRELAKYLDKPSLTAGVLPAEAGMDPKAFVARKLSPAEVAYETGCLQVGMHDRARAEESLARSLQLDPTLAGAHEELGYLRFDTGKDEEALAEWHKALSLDPNRARALFAVTMMGKALAQQSPEELRSTQVVLRQVTTFAPRFAAPYADLALIEWRLRLMQQAYKDAKQAEQLEPRRAGYRLLMGRILLHGQQEALAADYARYVADHWSVRTTMRRSNFLRPFQRRNEAMPRRQCWMYPPVVR